MNMCMPRINPSYHQSNNDYKTRKKQNTTKSHEYATEYAVNTSESYLWMINDTQPILFLRVRRANFNCLTSLLRSSNQPSFQHPVHHHLINTSRPRQNGQCYANDIFTRVTYNKIFEFHIKFRWWLGAEQATVHYLYKLRFILLMHKCVTRTKLVNTFYKMADVCKRHFQCILSKEYCCITCLTFHWSFIPMIQ